MKLPSYLENLEHRITIVDGDVRNLSGHMYSDRTVVFSENRDHFTNIVFTDRSGSFLKLLVKENIRADINLFIYGKSHTRLDFEIELEPGSKASIVMATLGHRNTSIHITKRQRVFQNSSLEIYCGLFGFKEILVEDTVDLVASGATFTQNLLNVATSHDTTVVRQKVNHLDTDTVSFLDNNLIAGSGASLDYDVSGYIGKGNHGSDCRQKNRGLLLGEESMIRVDPKLYIDEYDVIAEHGAAIGQINDEELFYLLSRGLSVPEARRLIVLGYLSDFYGKIRNNPLEKRLKQKIGKLIEGADET